MKLLDGAELAGYIKAEQARDVRSLKQAHGIEPCMVIVQDNATPLNSVYAKLKQSYAEDIGVQCNLLSVDTSELTKTVHSLNKDDAVHGFLVQLPISNGELTNELLSEIDPQKDIDGLGPQSNYDSAAATAIMWLLSGYNIGLNGKTVAVLGQGRLVGKPVSDLLEQSGVAPNRYDEHTKDLAEKLLQADVIISAAGQPELITSQMVKEGAVIIDAGTTSDGSTIRGDVSEALYEREDITITPKKGGVGPLTVAALFGNLLRAARGRVKS